MNVSHLSRRRWMRGGAGHSSTSKPGEGAGIWWTCLDGRAALCALSLGGRGLLSTPASTPRQHLPHLVGHHILSRV